MNARWVAVVVGGLASVAVADIVQYEDGDGNGSLWLTDLDAVPGADLSHLLLWWADLNGANLQGADLSESNLSYASLTSANLLGANLHGADLTFAESWAWARRMP